MNSQIRTWSGAQSFVWIRVIWWPGDMRVDVGRQRTWRQAIQRDRVGVAQLSDRRNGEWDAEELVNNDTYQVTERRRHNATTNIAEWCLHDNDIVWNTYWRTSYAVIKHKTVSWSIIIHADDSRGSKAFIGGICLCVCFIECLSSSSIRFQGLVQDISLERAMTGDLSTAAPKMSLVAKPMVVVWILTFAYTATIIFVRALEVTNY